MEINWRSIAFGLALLIYVTSPLGIQAAADGFVAGTAPDRRPPGAPAITAYEKSDAWFAAARRGVLQPYPKSLDFLKDQGGWFNPFTRPGMTGPYDIRGWHREGAAAAGSSN